ncbi:MAG: putative transrane protein [Bacteroidetes bacterium]|nr:putative transrane protein [Bacteroidota bacterium]
MKNLLTYLALLALLLSGSSCHRNRLKTSEKELTEKIMLQEKAEAEKMAPENKQSLNSNLPSAGFKYKEDRSVDPINPPVIIDIAGNLDNVREIKLSDVADEIRYVRMEPVPDTTIPADLKFKYHLMDNYIVAMNLYGIHLYSPEGKYLRSVVKNEITGVVIRPDMIMFYNDYTAKGGGMSVKSDRNDLFYNYSNTLTGEKYIMRFDCSSTPLIEEYRFDPEQPDRISGLGEISLDLNHGKTEPPKPQIHQGAFGGAPEWLNYEISVFMLDKNSYAVPSHRDNLLVIRNNYGDTLSEFTRFEKLVNYTKSLMRGTDDGAEYEYLGMFHIRPEFNDTVFRVIPPNRLYPVYVLNLGKYKVSKQEGVDPDFDLAGKIIPEEWAETDKYIFMTFTRDNYDCPNNRKNKTVKVYHALFSKQSGQLTVINALFSKQSGQLTVIKGDPYDYSSEILKNDFDGGVPVWPSSYMIAKSGEILISLKGKDIRERVKSAEFKISRASDEKKKELEKLAGSVSESDDILMIIK